MLPSESNFVHASGARLVEGQLAIHPSHLQLGREANDNDLAHANEVLGSLIERALLLADEANLPFVAINICQALELLDAAKGR